MPGGEGGNVKSADGTEITPEMREAIIRSVRSSQALSGLYLTREQAEAAFDAAMAMPPLQFDEKGEA